jgi:glycine dehydrogenase
MTQAFSEPITVSSLSASANGEKDANGHTIPDSTLFLSPFVARHLGPTVAEQAVMLAELGYGSLEELIAATVPAAIRLQHPLDLPKGLDEAAALAKLKTLASQNQVWRSYLGLGYANTLTPGIIQRNVLENPGWYTQYTPYQPEISQGRLEALLNYQTLITDLTGMEIANASLLDEGTAAAEAMTLAFNARKKKDVTRFWVSEACHPQTIDVVRTRAIPLGIDVVVGDHQTFDFATPVFGVLLQYPATDGAIYDYEAFIAQAHGVNVLATVAADLLSLTLLRPPGEFGADIVVGNSQRFGVPLGYGGPHAAFFATRNAFARKLPGRLVGVSKDSYGAPALRLALQTREQHIRRDAATSNICTAQVLLAIMASMYAVYHGPEGLKVIASRIHQQIQTLAQALTQAGFTLGSEPYFDTLRVTVGSQQAAILERATAHRINLRVVDGDTLIVALDETVTDQDLNDLIAVFTGTPPSPLPTPHSPLPTPHSPLPTPVPAPFSPTPPSTATTAKPECCGTCIVCKRRICPWRRR